MASFDILCCGELTIDEISETTGLAEKGSVKLKSTGKFFGGRGGNFAVYAALTGLHVGIMGSAGADSEGIGYRDHLQSRHIDISQIYNNKKAHTCKCFIFNDGRDSKIFFYGGALIEEREDYLDYLKKSINNTEHKILYCTSPDSEVNAMLLRSSHSRIKAFGPSSNIYSYSLENAEACLENTEMLFVNEHEAEFLGELLGMEMGEVRSGFEMKAVVETRGSEGSRIFTDGSVLGIRPFKAAAVADSNGAGDAFAGAFVADYYDSGDVVHAGRFASATASFVVEKIGCQSMMPTVEKVLERMEGGIA